MNIVEMNKYIKTMYDVSNVKNGFDYWYFKLFNILLGMFKYKNVPKGLSQRELELNLMMTGHASVIAKNDGTLFTPLSNLYGYDEYYQPTFMTFANPVTVSTKQYKIGVDCAVIYNCSLKDSLYYVKADGGLNSFVSRYARMLADLESTINIYTVNQRLTSFPVSTDGSVTESLKAFFKNLTLGKRGIISDDSIIEKFRNVDINRSNVGDGINDWLIAKDKILEQFFRELGVRMNNPKKAQVNTDEVEANDQLLLIQSDDMLNQRNMDYDFMNKMFGTNLEVELNPKFDIRNYSKGGEDNEA